MDWGIIWTDPDAQNLDGKGVNTAYQAKTKAALDTIPLDVSVYGGPRSGSLALVEADEAHSGMMTLYVLTVARTWKFVKVVS